MWELDHKENWVLKNWSFWILVLEKTLESPLDSKEIKPLNPKGNQSWIFIGRTDADAEIPVLWPPDVKNWLIWKDPDAGKDLRQEEKSSTEDEIIGWHCRLDVWVWANFRSCWWTGKPGMLQSMGSQRVGHDWAAEQHVPKEALCAVFLTPRGGLCPHHRATSGPSFFLLWPADVVHWPSSAS